MTREIKFRAYSSHNHKMYPVSNIEWDLDGRIWVIADDGKNGIELMDEEAHLMQYTGLHDKNGRKIYENDVLQCTSYTYGNGETGKVNLLVKYNEMSAGFIAGPYMLGKLMDIRKCEVIGNIFENPELLEAQQHD
ncbi:YopX family protein [Schleiferilactobacillus perolens]|uniref:YopX family protein n=1 Tax=Schleiferilactobacillus perolens TaxID=100468 RepID=UPI0039EB99D8